MATASWMERVDVEFVASELTGALGDSVTVLPIVVSLALLTDVSLPHVLLGFGLFQVVWGTWYGLPISVEPMKALAALAIAGVLSYPELVVVGVGIGAALLFVGSTGTLARIEPYLSTPVIRGVQLAVAFLLLEAGADLAVANPTMAAVGAVVALGVAVAGFRRGATLVVLGIGFAVAAASAGLPTVRVPGVPPVSATAFSAVSLDDVLGAGAAQLAMTVGNAAVATSLLFDDLFEADVSADDLASSMGVTNLLAPALGGIPMCHGSGGLAGKYAFGARTGLANGLLGVGYVALAFVVGGGFLVAFPMALLGVLLAVVAAQLGHSAFETENLVLTGIVGVLGLLTNVGAALVVGIALDWGRRRWFSRTAV
ncbi:putative sulfate/molybdate transporter [Halospeciosus flavus]|uniref:Sulfate/molybdate transporter n=1 Tax=Halospeciosus flavus TaxID=3032283 RepID=A0ABD5Z6D5_9EURY|nr:putative sulfate/molybdate transporter [Halospeciosus flavus]